MNSRNSIFLCTLVLVFGIEVIAQTSDKSAISTNARITLTVVDKDNQSFTTLFEEDLRVLEDGKPQQIIALERHVAVPVALSFLIDTSVSQELVIPVMRTPVTSFVNSVLRPGKDMAALATFTGAVGVKQVLTGNLQDVQSAVERLEFEPPPGYVSGRAVVAQGKLSRKI